MHAIMTLIEEEEIPFAPLIAVEMAGFWKRVADEMADASIIDPEAAYNALRDKAFA